MHYEMAPDLDRRRYDILRLVDRHGPIGSIQLVELMQLHGYSIKDRTIRLALSELDEQGFTEKVPGKGRTLTQKGREELSQGDVNGRLEQVRTRIATFTSKVSYDPVEDSGALVASSVDVDEADVDEALSLIDDLEAQPLGPVPMSIAATGENDAGDYRFLAPSSITLDGVLLNHGINSDLLTAGIVEYEPSKRETTETEYGTLGGQILRYTDIINGEGSSIDVVSLLIEANRSDMESVIEDGENGFLLSDDRTFPINRFEEARDLTIATRSALGGAVQFKRPREERQFHRGDLPWGFGSITYVGTGELVLSMLSEYGIAASWSTLHGIVARNEFDRVRALPDAREADD